MHRFAFVILCLGACGGGDDDPIAIDAANHDAEEPAPDAGPDAEPGRFDCLGDPLPTTADDPIQVGDSVIEVDAGGQSPFEGAVVTVFTLADVSLGTDTSDVNGTYGIEVDTSGTPLDGYLRSTAAGYLDTYLYPPTPLAASTDQALAVMVTSGTFDLLGTLAIGDAPTDGLGQILVIVADCNNDPVQGAVVTTSPAGTVRYNSNGFPSDTATVTGADGIAYVFNVAPGTVAVDASIDAMSLREHDVTARADVLTTTIVQP